MSLVRECTPRTLDGIVSFGERLSAHVVAAAFREHGVQASAVDARSLVVTDETFGAARVDFDRTDARICEWWKGETALPVVTGFIGATESGETTTLGRGGSDYTAAIFGAALDAEAIEIWTDVDGVMSADPRIVPTAFSMDSLRYDELMELSHFGAKVVYPPTVHPGAREEHPPRHQEHAEPRRFQEPGFAKRPHPHPWACAAWPRSRTWRCCASRATAWWACPASPCASSARSPGESVSVILISQASSEHSICFAIEPAAVKTRAGEHRRGVRARAAGRPHRRPGDRAGCLA